MHAANIHYNVVIIIIGAIAIGRAYFGEGIGPIHLDNLECTGNERELSLCPVQGGVANCQHTEDASVVCQGKSTKRLDFNKSMSMIGY